MALHVQNHFFEITINEPNFSNTYFNLFKKVDYPAFKKFILEEIKERTKELLLLGKIDTGTLINTDLAYTLALSKKGIPKSDIVYILRDIGPEGKKYFEFYSNGYDELKLTPIGKDWLFDTAEPVLIIPFSHFVIPDKASKKIQALLTEINNLPLDLSKYSNLVGHQLRTILALSLIDLWGLNGVPVPREKKDLKKLINFSVEQCGISKNLYLDQIGNELKDLKTSKIKELMDDIIHCEYSLINPNEINDAIKSIKHLLSRIYGR